MRYGMMRATPVVKNLIIVNVAVYLLMVLVPKPIGNFIWNYFYLRFPGSENFVISQFVTSMFVHFPGGAGHNQLISGHLVFNMISLYIFGSMAEAVWGAKRFFNYYLACGLGAAIFQVLMMYASHYHIIFDYRFKDILIGGGASGAIYGAMLAAAYLLPDNKVNLYFFIPVKLKILVPLLITIDQIAGLRGLDTGVAHMAHLGGAVTGLALCYGVNLKKWKK
jgi:membrane associated rhomboid family serine protease